MLAAENDVVPGAKVGGIGDVLRDIPRALANAHGANGQSPAVSVIIPAYNAFHQLPGATLLHTVEVDFADATETLELYELFHERDNGVRYFVLHHALFGAGGAGAVYCNDGSDRPFATDANKFALFSVGALETILSNTLGTVDVLHLHDWHTGMASVLREFHPRYAALKHIKTVFSIHNLALQGIRPLANDESSLQTWFPALHVDNSKVIDPRWTDCVNPVAASIRLADVVHTVSPSYSLEIIQPNSPERGFHGGEGLERELQQCAERNALVGIINGIDYNTPVANRVEWHSVMFTIGNTLLSWLGENDAVSTTDYVAHQRTQQWMASNRPRHVFTSVGRLTDQKMALLMETGESGELVLDELLARIKDTGVFILLGSGDADLEAKCRRSAAKHTNFLFLNRYAQNLSDLLFANGDVFLMPSSFEPCGISQMLAMRQGQPCLVHAVGGLRDTIKNNEDGFQFEGTSVQTQVSALLERFNDIIELRETEPDVFRDIANRAREQRFLWQTSAEQYLNKLYS